VLPLVPDPPLQYTDSICPGGNNNLVLTSAAVGNYIWNTGATTQSVTVHDVGEYSVTVYNASEPCPQSAEWEVFPIEPDPPILLTDSVCPGGLAPITLQADEPGQYVWSTGEHTGLIHVNDTGTYVVTIFMPLERCERTLQWYISPDTCYAIPELEVFVPNAFTPDGDGLNDFFGPVFSDPDMLIEYNFSIYDRWGIRIFETKDPNLPWIGQVDEGEHYVQDGVYIWKIVYTAEGIVEEVKTMGHVVMTR
jgi:gliding motility-associated-like protein